MEKEERVRIVRLANERYNAGDIEEAKNLYLRADYSAGLIRIADFYYEQQKPILAMLLYRKAGCRERVEELYEHAAGVIRLLMAEDEKEKAVSTGEERID